MVDLRQKVEEDRGLLKKIELIIPGFRGYRLREDLRIADRLLRETLVRELGIAANNYEEVRSGLVRKKELDTLEDAASLVIRINAMVEKIRHAEHGYTGISADHRIDIPELNKMYEWDLWLLGHIDNLNGISGHLRTSISTIKGEELAIEISSSLDALSEFEQVFEHRRAAFAGLEVREG
ncbi:MAG: hypothetical protein KAJ33_02420 [Thermoplasmata archaeon]|nr:hypothetical protein [Thermoplasmata archaeon]MCK5397086.1 hypothetical protein [Thermoplasmata archaeon]